MNRAAARRTNPTDCRPSHRAGVPATLSGAPLPPPAGRGRHDPPASGGRRPAPVHRVRHAATARPRTARTAPASAGDVTPKPAARARPPIQAPPALARLKAAWLAEEARDGGRGGLLHDHQLEGEPVAKAADAEQDDRQRRRSTGRHEHREERPAPPPGTARPPNSVPRREWSARRPPSRLPDGRADAEQRQQQVTLDPAKPATSVSIGVM